MLKSNPLQGIVEFDIHAEIVRIQFELIAWTYSSVLLNIHCESGNAAVRGKLPMLVAGGRCLKIDEVGYRGIHAHKIVHSRALSQSPT
jgi:hypothetical protein